MKRWLTWSPEGDETGTGDSGGAEGTLSVEDLQASVAKLEAKNREILGEKKATAAQLAEMKQTLDGLGGTEGVQALKQLQEKQRADEDAKLLEAGKLEEIKARAEADAANKVQAAEDRAREAQEKLDAQTKRAQQRDLEVQVRAAAAQQGVTGTAVDDVVLNAGAVFTHDDEGRAVIRDESGGVVVDQNGTPVTVASWLESQREAKRHWWGPSQGAGAQGGGGVAGGAVDVSKPATTAAEWEAKRKALGVESAQERQHNW